MGGNLGPRFHWNYCDYDWTDVYLGSDRSFEEKKIEELEAPNKHVASSLGITQFNMIQLNERGGYAIIVPLGTIGCWILMIPRPWNLRKRNGGIGSFESHDNLEPKQTLR